MSLEPNPALILGRLADERRLRVLSAVALGATSVAEAATLAGVSEDEAARALAHLVGAGMIRQGESGLEVDLGAFSRAARAASTPRKRADMSDASPEQAAVLRNFVDGEGRITALPARAAKRRLVLEYVAARFEPDREYGEREVNGVLLPVHDDVASMRRHLVDEGLLEREAGIYRRAASG
ncbi:MAG: DUF2087 domain-containing protein [Gaiellaceae bacterium]